MADNPDDVMWADVRVAVDINKNTPNVIVPYKSPETFKRFQEFAPEIREIVVFFAMKMADPRMVHLRAIGMGNSPSKLHGCPSDEQLAKSVIDGLHYDQAPAFFFVNHEWYYYAKKYYNIWFSSIQITGSPSPLVSLFGNGDHVEPQYEGLIVGQHQIEVNGPYTVRFIRQLPVMTTIGPTGAMTTIVVEVIPDSSPQSALTAYITAMNHSPFGGHRYVLTVTNFVMCPRDVLVCWYSEDQQWRRKTFFDLQFVYSKNELSEKGKPRVEDGKPRAENEKPRVENIMVCPWGRYTSHTRAAFDKKMFFLVAKFVEKLGNEHKVKKIFMLCQKIQGPVRYVGSQRRHYLEEARLLRHSYYSTQMSSREFGILRMLAGNAEFHFMEAAAIKGTVEP